MPGQVRERVGPVLEAGSAHRAAWVAGLRQGFECRQQFIGADAVSLDGLDANMRASDLTEEQLNKILHVITDRKWVVEGDLRRDITSNLKRLQAINCYRGIRHRKGLPVRGQRTSTNARTRKGPRKTVGVTKVKAEPKPA